MTQEKKIREKTQIFATKIWPEGKPAQKRAILQIKASLRWGQMFIKGLTAAKRAN